MTPGWLLAVLGCAGTWWIMWRYGWPHQIGGVKSIVLFGAALVCNIMTALFIFNWLAHKFGRDVDLPPELLADAGLPVDLQRLAEAQRGQAR